MRATEQFHNIENTQGGRKGHRLFGYSGSGRTFRVTPTGRTEAERWVARALTPRDGVVNEFRCATLAGISNQLATTE